MKNYYKLLLTGAMFFFLNFSFGQIDTSLQGKYRVISGAPIEHIEISDEKVEAYIGNDLVEKFFYFDKYDNHYVFEIVALDVESIEPASVEKDRKLMQVELNQLEDSKFLLKIRHPHGVLQEILMESSN